MGFRPVWKSKGLGEAKGEWGLVGPVWKSKGLAEAKGG